jgi:Tfp pilus assembly protein PilO
MTQKTKNILLILGFLLTAVIAYEFAIVNTLRLKKEYKTLKQEAVVFDNMPAQLSSLKQREKYYDSLLTKYQLGESSMQNSMLRTINTYAEANKLKVIGFIEPHKIAQNDLTINTYQFTLEGDYNAIITLIHQLEQNTKFGEIINLNFKKLKNHKTGEFYLQAGVLLKSFG